ncbi:nitroreductase [Streptomonospora alba]|uniref:Nitroreductase n=1 Tax=Streptomonospora alba TaxID=183763 RepID=A0A0C2FH01_9ACTN|nr:nitroreductase/quinone reductase family protein [Streptomonospora alba]KIH98554.1 nitroreductase [Streptomonospora alba]
MPSDTTFKALNALHRVVQRASGRRLGWGTSRTPALELTTTGRRSGKPHSVMLYSPLQDGDSYVVVASRGGDDRHPAWFLNLRDEPRIEVALQGGPRRPMVARVATSDERARMWPLITAQHRNYAGYQKRTSREIPLVLLTPDPPH